MKRAFTLIEILVVIAIISVLAAILLPVFARAKESAKKAACLSNLRQLQMATSQYVSDADGYYPETKDPSSDPATFDADGSLDEPDYASVFDLLLPYVGSKAGGIPSCPSDPDPQGKSCLEINPDTPTLTSYVVNAYLVFGINESSIPAPAALISFAERRSSASTDSQPFCDYVYHPWFNPTNSESPENQMDEQNGAIATGRHNEVANYVFIDGHTKPMHWTQTFSLPSVDLHHP